MMQRFLTLTALIVVVSVSISIAGPGYNRGGDCLNCDMPKWSCDKHAGGAIDLTDEQQAELDALRKAEFEKLEPLREKMQKLRDEMHKVMESDPVDENRLRQLAREKADRKVDLKIAKKAFHDKVAEILTPEQLEQLKQRREAHHGKHGRHGKHGPHAPGGCGNCYGPGK